jgi:hypothetical protein
VTDVRAAIDALRAAGCSRLLLVGSCFGAIPGVVASAEREDVDALILLSPPLVLPGGGRVASVRERIRETFNLRTFRLLVTNREYRRWFFTRLVALARTRVAVKLGRIGNRRTPDTPSASHGAELAGGLLVEAELARLVTTRRHVEVVYGAVDGNLARVEDDMRASRSLGLLRDRPGGLVWTVLDGPVHGLEDTAVQEQLISLVVQRACDLNGRAP